MEFTTSNTPFIRLPPPHQNITITPPLHSDGSVHIASMNHPSVYMNILSPPFPYTQADWDERFLIRHREASASLTDFLDAKELGNWVGALPVTCIRELGADGVERYIGDLAVWRGEYLGIKDEEERERRKIKNANFEVGDERIDWEIGYHLSPTVHGRGIMSAVLKTLIEVFLGPWMNVRHLTAGYFDNNAASRKKLFFVEIGAVYVVLSQWIKVNTEHTGQVLEKNGFVFVERIENVLEFPESKTGGVKGKMISMNYMSWDWERGQEGLGLK